MNGINVLNKVLQVVIPHCVVSDEFVSGSTNWRVKKYADGFCEIEGSKYFEGLYLSAFVFDFTYTGDLELSLPITLTSLIGAWADGVIGYGKKVHCSATTKSVLVRVESFDKETVSGTVSLRIVGRWK
ncbi:hypothetical protein NE619_13085 [Anaerovorax odorimutans]|uniref:Uncharacterized protein n=1 Tax=Anaerovorax odorimutans TaxID=109327 RepID=A0ABT1RS10_9FIRM|nr:hypothetical protein [Anaerovorax odorimutans]MCQ4637661.1 hypothetical protein [Anaerovorax odorimutans]